MIEGYNKKRRSGKCCVKCHKTRGLGTKTNSEKGRNIPFQYCFSKRVRERRDEKEMVSRECARLRREYT